MGQTRGPQPVASFLVSILTALPDQTIGWRELHASVSKKADRDLRAAHRASCSFSGLDVGACSHRRPDRQPGGSPSIRMQIISMARRIGFAQTRYLCSSPGLGTDDKLSPRPFTLRKRRNFMLSRRIQLSQPAAQYLSALHAWFLIRKSPSRSHGKSQ